MDRTNSFANWDTIEAIDVSTFIKVLTDMKNNTKYNVTDENLLDANTPASVGVSLDPKKEVLIVNLAAQLASVLAVSGTRIELVDGFLLYACPQVVDLLDIKIFLVSYT